MKQDNIVLNKSYQFSLRAVKLYKYLCEEKKEYVLSKQVLRSATSIGANTEEAVGAQSKADFIFKIQVAFKECRETHYWLRLLMDSEYLDKKLGKSLLGDCEELLKLLNAILKTAKSNKQKAVS